MVMVVAVWAGIWSRHGMVAFTAAAGVAGREGGWGGWHGARAHH